MTVIKPILTQFFFFSSFYNKKLFSDLRLQLFSFTMRAVVCSQASLCFPSLSGTRLLYQNLQSLSHNAKKKQKKTTTSPTAWSQTPVLHPHPNSRVQRPTLCRLITARDAKVWDEKKSKRLAQAESHMILFSFIKHQTIAEGFFKAADDMNRRLWWVREFQTTNPSSSSTTKSHWLCLLN